MQKQPRGQPEFPRSRVKDEDVGVRRVQASDLQDALLWLSPVAQNRADFTSP